MEQRRVLINGLGERFKVTFVEDRHSCLDAFKAERFDFTFVDIDFLSADGEAQDFLKESLTNYWKVYPAANIIILASVEKTRIAVKAVKIGAEDYLNYPIDKSELDLIISSIDESNTNSAYNVGPSLGQ